MLIREVYPFSGGPSLDSAVLFLIRQTSFHNDRFFSSQVELRRWALKPVAPPELRVSKRRAAAGDARAGAATDADEREVSSSARPKEIRARARSRDFAEGDEEKIERV